jgi:hypothetical protein
VVGGEHASLESLNQHFGGLSWFKLRLLPDKSQEYVILVSIVPAANLFFFKNYFLYIFKLS